MATRAMPVLCAAQVIVGLDLHLALPPGALLPHPVVWWVGAKTSRSSGEASVRACGSRVAARPHDAGPRVAHLLPNRLVPLILERSTSKAEHGSRGVLVGEGEAAVNDRYVAATMHHCQDFPVPRLPSGEARSDGITVFAGYDEDDELAGANAARLAASVEWAIVGFIGRGAAVVRDSLVRAAAAFAFGAEDGGRP